MKFFRKMNEMKEKYAMLKIVNNVLLKLKLELENKNEELESKIRERDKLIEILMRNQMESRAKIVDLENNLEVIVNSLSPKQKELARPEQSTNSKSI